MGCVNAGQDGLPMLFCFLTSFLPHGLRSLTSRRDGGRAGCGIEGAPEVQEPRKTISSSSSPSSTSMTALVLLLRRAHAGHTSKSHGLQLKMYAEERGTGEPQMSQIIRLELETLGVVLCPLGHDKGPGLPEGRRRRRE